MVKYKIYKVTSSGERLLEKSNDIKNAKEKALSHAKRTNVGTSIEIRDLKGKCIYVYQNYGGYEGIIGEKG